MKRNLFSKFIVAFLVSGSVLCVDFSNSQRRFNPNTDFLLHEAGQNPTIPPKRDYVASQPTKPTNKFFDSPSIQLDNAKEFPALGPRRQNSQSTLSPNLSTTRGNQATTGSGKRDYVAPQWNNRPSQGPAGTTAHTTKGPTTSSSTTVTRPTQSSGLRDYVAPQRNNNQPSTPGKPTSSPFANTPSTQHTTSGRRDYVAPHGTTGSGRVKDLVNFYDNKDSTNVSPHSSTNLGINGATTPSTLRPSSSFTTKPFSYSAVAGGSTKPISTASIVTQKPTSNGPSRPSSPQFTNPAITQRPSTPVLPSSIVNSNKPSNNGNGVTNSELESLSEELLRKDVNNAAKYITINYQEKTNSYSKEDKAPIPLLTIAPEAWNIPTIQKFVPLLDNYEKDISINEHVTPLERNEENAFMDAIMSTSVIRTLMNFFKEKGYVTPDPKQQRDFLKQLWFSLYSRQRGKVDSSAFEHVFVSERRRDEVLGLHNWIYFAKEEAANRVNYLGYLKYVTLGDKGAVIKVHMTVDGLDKPVNSIIVGSSPELDIALYTLCFVTRSEKDCRLKLANKDVSINTFISRYRGKNLIGSAFPQI